MKIISIDLSETWGMANQTDRHNYNEYSLKWVYSSKNVLRNFLVPITYTISVVKLHLYGVKMRGCLRCCV
jgi:hypothetical protein